MVQNVNTPAQSLPTSGQLIKPRPALPQSFSTSARVDSVSFKASISTTEAQGIVVERAFEQLRAVVEEARAELGIPAGETLDTSPEATANRIADFALNFFSQYAENNGLADDEAGRAQFAEFIGGAIGEGIEEARGILTALSALNPEVESGIDETASSIQRRLNDFVSNGLI